MTTVLLSICFTCRRLDRSEDDPAGIDSFTCAAYPSTIPSDIQLGADHRVPRGDEVDGMVFSGEVSPMWLKLHRIRTRRGNLSS